jgi:hypothetical protein
LHTLRIRRQQKHEHEIQPRRGIVVRALSSGDMREIYQAVTGLEVMAVFLMTEGRLTRNNLKPLFAALKRMDEATQASDLEVWGEADEAFHRGLLLLCGNSRIRRIGVQFHELAQRAHLVAMRLQPISYLAQSAAAHRELVDLILAGDLRQGGCGTFSSAAARQGNAGERRCEASVGSTLERSSQVGLDRIHRFPRRCVSADIQVNMYDSLVEQLGWGRHENRRPAPSSLGSAVKLLSVAH